MDAPFRSEELVLQVLECFHKRGEHGGDYHFPHRHTSSLLAKPAIVDAGRDGEPLIHNTGMAIKAVAVDDENTEHLIIGLNRDNVNDLLDGDVFTLPRGMAVTLTEKSDIVLLFAETDEELERRFPARLRPI